ncbi:MAG: OmpA family protein [Deltaproteobacteria bacterium]|nr:OmpA family protein [Deltaproteobacteria bacterium]
MQRTALLTLMMVWVAACGIPQDKHNAVLKDLKACQTTLANTKSDLEGVTSERDKVKEHLGALGGEKDALAKRLGATKTELSELRKQRTLAEARNRTFRNLVKRLRAMIDSGKLKVKIRKGRMIVQLSDKILFDPGKKKLKKEGRKPLEDLAQVLKDIGGRDFLIAGHTDNVPIKTRRFRSNWELSAARAVEVVKFLQQQGVDPKHLAAAGFSEFDPTGDNATDDGKRTNRRIEIVLMPNIEELPKIDL